MELKYQIEDRPSWKENLVYGLQWLAVTLPAIVIIGKVLGGLNNSIEMEILYLQKIFAVTGLALLIQIFGGHRLPLVIGPATVLLIGILASQGSSPAAIYSSILIGGLILTLLAVTGLFARLQSLFTPRVVAVILLLVAFTMMPTIIQLICNGEDAAVGKQLLFALAFILLMFLGQRYLQGLLKSSLILISMVAGSIAYFLVNPSWIFAGSEVSLPAVSFFAKNLTTNIVIEPGLLIAFLLCFLGLSINDLGSIQAVGSVLKADNMPKRITRGITATGIANSIAGFFGVIGPVNFSFNPGIIASTGCAARRSLVPTGVALLILAFLPALLFYLSFIPKVVIGCVLLFTLCTQVAAGLMSSLEALEKSYQPRFDSSLLIALPILVGIVVAFLPADITATFPPTLKPILSNGFVMGVVVSLLLEHVIFRSKV
ncbi:MAG: purine/pyrimidine permease [Syntrophomonadaceae bacterium]|nr:purine/pyrimidine permease [Syntrophomonadaceae bacterium]